MLPHVEKLGLERSIDLSILAKRNICNYPSKNNFLLTCSFSNICFGMSSVISIFNISISFTVCVYFLMVPTMDGDLLERTFSYL